METAGQQIDFFMEPERSAPEPGRPPRRPSQRPRFPRRHPGPPRRDQPQQGPPRPENPQVLERNQGSQHPTVQDALRQIDMIRKTLEGVLRDMSELAKMVEAIELDHDAAENEIQKLRDALHSLDRSR